MEPDAFDITSLDGVTTGRWELTTAHGTRHLLDLDARTITRLPAPGREFPTESLGPLAPLRADGVAVPARIVAKHGAVEAARRLADLPGRHGRLAGERGDRVHAYAEAVARSGPRPAMEPEDAGYVNALHGFVERYSPDWVAIEATVFNRAVGYAGTADFLAYIDGRLVVGDYKTSKSLYPKVALQLAAIAHAELLVSSDGVLVEIPRIAAGLAVRLGADGSFDFCEANLAAAWPAFAGLVAAWRWEHSDAARLCPVRPLNQATRTAA